MTIKRIFFFFALLNGTANLTFGQGFTPPTTIRTPYGNVTTPGVYRPVNYNYGAYQIAKIYKKAQVQLVLPNDSIINTKATYDAESKQNTITIKGKKGVADKVYKPNDTKRIVRILKTGVKPMVGIPADSCWLFKVIAGKINAYSNVPLPDTFNVTAIQNGQGSIMALTKENLLAMMPSRSEKLDKLINKDKLIEAINLFNSTGGN